MKPCVICKKEFETKVGRRDTCSDLCSKKLKQKRMKAYNKKYYLEKTKKKRKKAKNLQ